MTKVAVKEDGWFLRENLRRLSKIQLVLGELIENFDEAPDDSEPEELYAMAEDFLGLVEELELGLAQED